MEAEPIKGLVWNLYREHIRSFSHAAIKGEPSLEEIFIDVVGKTDA